MPFDSTDYRDTATRFGYDRPIKEHLAGVADEARYATKTAERYAFGQSGWQGDRLRHMIMSGLMTDHPLGKLFTEGHEDEGDIAGQTLLAQGKVAEADKVFNETYQDKQTNAMGQRIAALTSNPTERLALAINASKTAGKVQSMEQTGPASITDLNMNLSPLDRLKTLGRIHMQNDPSFDPASHEAMQLQGGPFKEAQDRQSLWRYEADKNAVVPVTPSQVLNPQPQTQTQVPNAGPIADAAFNKSFSTTKRPTLGGR